MRCGTCRDYQLCLDCGRRGRSVGEGSFRTQVYVPPLVRAGNLLQVPVPDEQVVEVRVPRRAVAGTALNVFYDIAGETEAAAEAVAEVAAEPKGGPEVPRVLGFRWFLVLACGLVQLLLAPTGWLPWLPADKVLVTSRAAWCLWFLLLAFVVLSTMPAGKEELVLLRFTSAATQGYVFGHLIAFDWSTFQARLGFAVLLGVANAFDRLGSTEASVSSTWVVPAVGAQGVYEVDGIPRRVQLSRVEGDEAVIQYLHQPRERPATETVLLQNRSLVLRPPPKELVDGVKRMVGSFEARPWGFSLGVIISQWVLESFTRSDAFAAGILTQQALVIASCPFVAMMLWCLAQREPDWVILALLCLVFVGLCLVALATMIPFAIGLTVVAIMELITHQVVVFVAIPVDALVVLAMWNPSAEEVATQTLTRTCRRAVGLVPGAARRAWRDLENPGSTAAPLLDVERGSGRSAREERVRVVPQWLEQQVQGAVNQWLAGIGELRETLNGGRQVVR